MIVRRFVRELSIIFSAGQEQQTLRHDGGDKEKNCSVEDGDGCG